MSTDTGGPAFPLHPSADCRYTESGMTLRDYFAAKALESCGFTVKPYNTTAETAEKCYAMADAMLKEREQ